jgi:peptidoglycan hydrolase CwlO-like protein
MAEGSQPGQIEGSPPDVIKQVRDNLNSCVTDLSSCLGRAIDQLSAVVPKVASDTRKVGQLYESNREFEAKYKELETKFRDMADQNKRQCTTIEQLQRQLGEARAAIDSATGSANSIACTTKTTVQLGAAGGGSRSAKPQSQQQPQQSRSTTVATRRGGEIVQPKPIEFYSQARRVPVPF